MVEEGFGVVGVEVRRGRLQREVECWEVGEEQSVGGWVGSLVVGGDQRVVRSGCLVGVVWVLVGVVGACTGIRAEDYGSVEFPTGKGVGVSGFVLRVVRIWVACAAMVDRIENGSGRRSGLRSVRKGQCAMFYRIEREELIWLVGRSGEVAVAVEPLAHRPNGAKARDRALGAHSGLAQVLG